MNLRPMSGKSILAKNLTRWCIERGQRVHVVRLGDTGGHIVQKIKGEVCWIRVPKRPAAKVEVPQLEFYDEVFDIDLAVDTKGEPLAVEGQQSQGERSQREMARFEAWATKLVCPYNLRRMRGGYVSAFTHNAWMGWQAAIGRYSEELLGQQKPPA